jgi:hypothetical protein
MACALRVAPTLLQVHRSSLAERVDGAEHGARLRSAALAAALEQRQRLTGIASDAMPFP